jgi:hypothetical protein
MRAFHNHNLMPRRVENPVRNAEQQRQLLNYVDRDHLLTADNELRGRKLVFS